MKKFPFKKLVLIILIAVFVACLSAVLSACELAFITTYTCARTCEVACDSCQQSCIKSCNEANYTTSYELNEDGTAYILTHYSREFDDVVIPETYKGLPVTTIATDAFKYASLIDIHGRYFNSITLPSTITTIKECAFSINNHGGGSSFGEVYFNGTLEQFLNIDMGDDLLYGTEKLYVDNVEIVDLAIPESITEIPQRFFRYYNGLESVTFPQSLTSIGEEAFYQCNNLKFINIPNGLQTVCDRAFYNCSIESPLGFSQNIESIGEDAFYYNVNLNEVIFNQNASVSIEDGAFDGCGISYLDIPKDVKLNGAVFADCTNLKYLQIASPEIGECAFYGCKSLAKIEFADSVTTIGKAAFRNCTSIQTLNLSQTNVQVIGEYAFMNCGLHLLYLPETLENLGGGSFSDNERLYEVYNLSQIELRAGWSHYSGISHAKAVHTALSEPLQVECEYGWYFFDGEEGYELFAWEEYVFLHGNIELPVTEKSYVLANGIFRNTEASTVFIPSCVSAIGQSAFENCSNLYWVIFSEGLKSIGNFAFYNCPLLYKVILPEGLENLGIYAFSGCIALETVILPSTLTNVNTNVFTNCHSISTIVVHNDNPTYYADGNCLIERDSNVLILGSVKSIIPEGVTTIGRNAFEYRDIEKLVVPEGVTTICANAFYYCENLSKITLPSTLEVIESSSFRKCPSLKNITLPNGLKFIGQYAFEQSGLTEITLPGSVEEVGYNAFAECESLTKITLSEGVEHFSFNAIYNCYNLSHLYLPEKFDLSRFTPYGFMPNALTIHYAGTVAEWYSAASEKFNEYNLTVICSDGRVFYGFVN